MNIYVKLMFPSRQMKNISYDDVFIQNPNKIFSHGKFSSFLPSFLLSQSFVCEVENIFAVNCVAFAYFCRGPTFLTNRLTGHDIHQNNKIKKIMSPSSALIISRRQMHRRELCTSNLTLPILVPLNNLLSISL